MSLPENNPNYKNTKEFMPSSYDKELFDNGDQNTYDSLWMSMKDTAQDVVFKHAMK